MWAFSPLGRWWRAMPVHCMTSRFHGQWQHNAGCAVALPSVNPANNPEKPPNLRPKLPDADHATGIAVAIRGPACPERNGCIAVIKGLF
jgi:hypothetical protein